MQVDQGVDLIKGKLLAMASLAEDMVERSVHALLEGDDEVARQVRADDDKLDAMEQEVDELAMEILTMGPMATDLRAITIGMKISNDLERVGDEASTICKRIININKHADWKVPLREEIAAMGEKACLLLRKSMDAYVEHDSEKARQLIPQDEGVDTLNKMYQKQLIQSMMANPQDIPMLMQVGVIVKRIERVGDHAINIAEDVVFIEEAADIRHNN